VTRRGQQPRGSGVQSIPERDLELRGPLLWEELEPLQRTVRVDRLGCAAWQTLRETSGHFCLGGRCRGSTCVDRRARWRRRRRVGVCDYSSGGQRTVAVRVTATKTGRMCVCEC
jgi:hypothetical protein